MKRCAIAVLKLPDGRMVFQRRTSDAPANAGLLGHFGGHIEAGEAPDQAVKRELSEETSLNTGALEYKPLEPFTVDRQGEAVEYWPFEVLIADMNLAVYEGERAEAYAPSSAMKRNDITSSVRFILEKITGEANVSAN